RIKVNGIIIVLAVILVVFFPDAFLREGRVGVADEFLKIMGFGMILLGQLLRVSARGYKSEQSQNSRALVCTGPYMLVRNPMYLGILLIGSGVVLVLFQWWVAVIFLSVFIARYLLLMLYEEKKLLALFPREYKEYMLKVPRIFPAFGMLRRQVSECLPFKFAWLKKEIASILAVVLITLGIEFWQKAKSSALAAYPEELAAAVIVILLFFCFSLYLNKKTYEAKEEVTIKSRDSL
ncbi:MAG: isoprenylcysteine carboxylmethyltransferase family protein, partial [Candidatus Omnitrophota bacterium]|nr:isoprenylcysteine carboxylmethyltransferase family protein [Candidatus Omnitrophota bacterium]